MISDRPHVLLLGHAPDPNLPTILGWLGATMNVTMLTEPMTKPVACDWLVSYRYHWVVPAEYLIPGRSLNFHPGPPEYPGIGSTDWALHHGATRFGVTAHWMASVPDTGTIIAVRRFDIRPRETLTTLTQRAHAHLLALADDILTILITGGTFPVAPDRWVGRPRTRKDLHALQETIQATRPPQNHV